MQDNQSLGYGLLAMERMGLPVLATIHHPITVDRRLEMEHAETSWGRHSKARWYAFTKMQTRVASRMPRVITVSQNSLDDISTDHKVSKDRLHVVPVGVDQDLFRPLPGVDAHPGPAHHHGQRRRHHEGPALPARGPGQAAHRA